MAKAVISLDKGASAVQYSLEVDWHEVGRNEAPIPMLAFVAPAAGQVAEYLYDVPGGAQRRPPLHQDVPGLQYGAALLGDKALAILTDCKYGYRGADDRIGLTLLHAANSPDPYPDRGIHKIRLAVAVAEASPKALEEAAFDFSHLPGYVPAGAHAGSLPPTASLLTLSEDTGAVLSGVKGAEDGNGLIVRLYNTLGTSTAARLTFASDVRSAALVDLLEASVPGTPELAPSVDGQSVSVRLDKFSLVSLRIVL